MPWTKTNYVIFITSDSHVSCLPQKKSAKRRLEGFSNMAGNEDLEDSTVINNTGQEPELEEIRYALTVKLLKCSF